MDGAALIGTEVILNPGDWLFVEDPRDDIRNAGTDDVVLPVAGLTRVARVTHASGQ